MFYWILVTITFVLLAGYSALLIYLRKGFDRLRPGDLNYHPTVAVIIPAHNEEKNLPHLLDCLSRQDYPVHFREIILVNDRSVDQTYKIMETFASKYSNVKVIRIHDTVREISPKKRAITKGINSSTGEIILTTDADSSPGPNWISEMVQAYRKDTGMVYRTNPPFNTLFHRILALDYFAMGAIAASSVGINHPTTCNGANLSYRREIFQKVNGFGETAKLLSGDDDLFLHRVHKKCSLRINFTLTPGSVVFNNPPENFRKFVRQRIRFASKHLAYPLWLKAILSGIYLFNISLLWLIIGSFLSISYLPILIITLFCKAAFEIIFLSCGQHFLEKRNFLWLYPIAAIPHIFYVVFFPLLGQFRKKKW